MTNLENIKAIWNHQNNIRTEDDQEILVGTQAFFDNLEKEVDTLEDWTLRKDADTEDIILTDLSNGESIKVKVEKQIHEKIDRTQTLKRVNIGGDKKVWYTLIAFSNGNFEVWTSDPDLAIGRSGQRVKRKMVKRTTSKASATKEFNRMTKEAEAKRKEA